MGFAKESLYGVTRYNPSKAYSGYTLFAPLADFFVWLIDMQGRVVHRWKMPYTPGQQGILLPNGNLLYLGRTETHKGPEQHLGGYSGTLLEADWDGNVVWEYENDYIHHDFWRKDNGNTLIIRWYGMMPEDVEAKIKGGLSPGAVIGTRLGAPGKMWATAIQEITPDGKIVWEWKDYEHLDPKLDIISPLDWRSEWMHCNSIEELPHGNILISARSLSTIYIINKATGDVKWRWGPAEIAHQHDATFLENGNILCFDNGMGRFNSEINYSRVVEVNPKTNRIEWEYKDNPPTEFYSGIQAGCQRLPNGKVVWEWFSYEHLDPGVDIICPVCPRNEWTGANACEVLPDGNILTSFMKTNTIAIIDKNTGAIKWRWGAGEVGHPHHPTTLNNGNILLLDNGRHCTGLSIGYSRILEVNPKTEKMEWNYMGTPWCSFFSSIMGSCQPLPDSYDPFGPKERSLGNILVCKGTTGRIFEITHNREIVWEYVSPFYYDTSHFGQTNMIFRVYRYGPEYEGLKGERAAASKFRGTVQEKIKTGEERKTRVHSRLEDLGY